MAHYQVVAEGELAADVANRSRFGGKAGAAFLVGRERDRAHHADDLCLAHERMSRQAFPLLLQVGACHVADMLDDLLVLEDADVLECNGGGDRVAGIGVAVVELVRADDRGDLVGDDRGADGLVARGEALGDGDDVGPCADGFMAEPVAGPSEAADHLVADQQDLVLVADALDLGPIAVGRHDHAARTLDRFGDEGGDAVLAQFEDLLLQLAGPGDAEVMRGHLAALEPPVGLVDVVDIGNRQRALLVHRHHAAQRSAGHRGTVIGVLAADHDILGGLALEGPVVAHHAQVGIVRVRAAGGEEDVVEIAGHDLGQL